MPSSFVENNTCTSTWFTPNNSSCECGSSLGGKVKCDKRSENVSLLKCYLMTLSADSESMLVVGWSLYGCLKHPNYDSYYPIPSNSSRLKELCSRYHREGQMCGRCEEGFAPPAYSYDLSCVNCTNHHASNWIKYVSVLFLPLTLLFIIIVACRVSVNSGLMNTFVLLSQIVSIPFLASTYTLKSFHHQVAVLYSI